MNSSGTSTIVNSNSIKPHSQKDGLWISFCNDHKTLSDLKAEAENWLAGEIGKHIYPKWDNKFHTINEKKKLYYIASYGTSANGSPWVKVVIKDHKNDCITSFDCKEARKQLFQEYKARLGNNNPTNAPIITPSSKTLTTTSTPTKQKTNLQEAEEKRELARKARKQAKAAEAFNKGLIPTQSQYLERKGLQQITSDAIRYYPHSQNGYLVCKLFNINGELVGYQKISDKKVVVNGELQDKKFVYGTKSQGAFTPLTRNGKLPDKPKIIYIAESIGTGSSVKEAIDFIYDNLPTHKGKVKQKPIVICAYYADNFPKVVAALRGKFGKKSALSIYLAPDNDQWKQNKINEKTGFPIGNKGLIIANKTAIKHNCLVVYPNFEGFNTTNEPTDFNDLHQLGGLAEVARQLKQAKKPDPKYAFFKEKQKEAKRLEELFSRYKVINLNERYLPNTLADELIKHKTVILRSPIGTGKTEIIKSILDKLPNETALYISHLISLTGQASDRLNLEIYSDIKGTSANLWEIQKLSCCVNSLPMLIRKGKIRTFRVLIIDEIEQLLSRLTTKIAHKSLILECLEHLVKSAELLVVADAHISKTTLHILSKWREDKFLVINNTYEVGTGRKIILHELPGSIQEDAIKELSRTDKKGKVFIVSNNKKLARQTYKLLQPIITVTQKKALYISGDNSNDKEVIEFFANPNEMVKQYDLIIATPSVNTGLSIEDPTITFVAGLFSSRINTACDAMQALGRVRNSKNIHCWIDERKANLPTDKKQILARWTTTFNYDLALMGFTVEDTLTISNPIYEQLVYDVTHSQNISKNNFFGHFLKLAAFDGYSIEYKELGIEQKKERAKLQKLGRETEAQEYVTTRANELNLEDKEAEEIETLSRRTFSQTRALDKHKVRKFYRLPDDAPIETVESTLTRDDRGKLRNKVINLETALLTDEQLKEKYQTDQKKAKENGDSKRLTPDYKLYATKREFFLAVLLAVGITQQLQIKQVTTEDDPNKTTSYFYTKESDSITSFINWVIDRRDILEGIVNIPNNEKLKENPLQFISYQLRKLGLEQNRFGKNENCEYKVVEATLNNMRQILLSRGIIEELAQNDNLAKESTNDDQFNLGTPSTINNNNNKGCPQINQKGVPNKKVSPVKECPKAIADETKAPLPTVERELGLDADKLEELDQHTSNNPTNINSPEATPKEQLQILSAALTNPHFKDQHKAMFWRCRDLTASFNDISQEGLIPNKELLDFLSKTTMELLSLGYGGINA